MTIIYKDQNPSLQETFNEFVKRLQEIQKDLPNDISDDKKLHIHILHTIHLYKEYQSMTNNPPLTSTDLILTINSIIKKTMTITLSLNDLMTKAYIISLNPSTYYIK